MKTKKLYYQNPHKWRPLLVSLITEKKVTKARVARMLGQPVSVINKMIEMQKRIEKGLTD